MSFDALGEDVLLRIFCFCDISTVLAVSAINQAIRRIALAKQLWLSLVLDHRFRGALDLPPPNREQLECLSTKELIAVIKKYCRRTGLTSEFPLDDVEDRSEARLLLGARYLLLHSISTTHQRLCIYDVWSARRVWHRLVQAHIMYQADLVPGGAIARVFSVQTVDHPQTYPLHVEEIDLTTGASHELFNFSLDRTVFGVEPRAIVGDFLLSRLLHSSNGAFVLINWRASTFVYLGRAGSYYVSQFRPYTMRFSPDVQLIPGHIRSTYQETSPPYAHILAVTPLEAFSDRWQPLTEIRTAAAAQLEAGSAPTITIENITRQERLEYNHRPLRPESVTATPDALHAGAYNISVHGVYFPRPRTLMGRIGNLITMTARRGKAPPEPAQALLAYRFTPEQGQASSKLRLISARGWFIVNGQLILAGANPA
ncbi:F-box domain-containing protein [Mycena sanguinolenta]|uniref:F-box domain-containing protein n=1 Tax=Mycena sanguinolenta TaxID=230812 RepID=A0A8H6Y6P4_9AGAR|nr:F-box domain-containing protein [Mycena sanguinolenta]